MVRKWWIGWAAAAGVGLFIGCSSSGTYRPTLFRKKDKPELSAPMPDQGPYLGDGVNGYPIGNVQPYQPGTIYQPPPGTQPPAGAPIPSFPQNGVPQGPAPVPQGPTPHTPGTSTNRGN